MNGKCTGIYALLIFLFTGISAPLALSQQQMSNYDRVRAEEMLSVIAKDIEKKYYDPKLHGIDWEAKVQEAKEKIGKATSLNMSLSHIAAALNALNDSHTFFLPPSRPYRHDYGWQIQMIGKKCFVVRVRPGSDSESKGVKPGDQVVLLDGYAPERNSLWQMNYVYDVLRPQPGLHVAIRDPQGHDRMVDVMAKFTPTKKVTDLTGQDGASDIWDLLRRREDQYRMMRPRYAEKGDGLMILKIPSFSFDMTELDSLIGKARKHKALIIDLRDDPGGFVDSLKFMVSKVFDDDVKVADRVGRKEHKPEIAKTKGHDSFNGKLIVLVDSNSASASELFARVVQLQKRGVVIGDQSSGSVMESRRYTYSLGLDTAIFYGASITDADLIMADGKSLEHVGVTPDDIVIPTGADLASGRDPVMAHAAETVGVKLSPEDAGKLFPYEWPPE